VRIARFQEEGRTGWGFVDGDTLIPAAPGDVTVEGALSGGNDGLPSYRARANGRAIGLDGLRLLAPLERPSKIIAVGLNYRDHAAESHEPLPTRPLLFAKLPSSIIGDHDPICLPSQSDQVDWEVELGVVIGRRARRVSQADALAHVGGYTIVNDVSARDLQTSDGQWMRAKSFDTFTPMGPWITTTDELGDASGLGIRLWVNGQLKQSGNTSDLVFGVAALVSFCSQAFTLEPGDVISSGTPSGVGNARKPPEYLHEGDALVLEIDGIGRLHNTVRRDAP
jgi:2-keto-4-pentenoate hydratase/2-oxohepta-3-ene-1,7-dioic acid hydratase in catechol pathway